MNHFNRKKLALRFKDKSYKLTLIALTLILFAVNGIAQVTPFEKSVLDSLSANDFNFSVGFLFNASEDGTSSLTTGTDIGMMYSTKKSNYELIQSSYFSRLESFSSSNRFIALIRGDLFSHDTLGERVIEKRFYPEPFALYMFDASRSLNFRIQLGVNAIWAPKPTKLVRIRVGLGILKERENWQMIKHEQLPALDTLPQAVLNYIYDSVGINKQGRLERDNWRANLYSNFLFNFTKNINMNAFVSMQMPFDPPYTGLPQNSHFPVVTKRYPRLTLDMQLNIHVWGKLDFVTAFHYMYDKGQIPIYVPNWLYNFSQGLQLSL